MQPRRWPQPGSSQPFGSTCRRQRSESPPAPPPRHAPLGLQRPRKRSERAENQKQPARQQLGPVPSRSGAQRRLTSPRDKRPRDGGRGKALRAARRLRFRPLSDAHPRPQCERSRRPPAGATAPLPPAFPGAASADAELPPARAPRPRTEPCPPLWKRTVSHALRESCGQAGPAGAHPALGCTDGAETTAGKAAAGQGEQSGRPPHPTTLLPPSPQRDNAPHLHPRAQSTCPRSTARLPRYLALHRHHTGEKTQSHTQRFTELLRLQGWGLQTPLLLIPVHIPSLLSRQLRSHSSSPFVRHRLSRWTAGLSSHPPTKQARRRQDTPAAAGPRAGRALPIFPIPAYSPPKPTDSSQSLEQLPEEGTSPTAAEGAGVKSPISARISFHSSPPPLPTSCSSPRPFPLALPLLFPPFSGLPPLLLPSGPAAWHTAFSTRCLYAPLPGASGDDTDFVPVPSPAFVREKKMPRNPASLLGDCTDAGMVVSQHSPQQGLGVSSDLRAEGTFPLLDNCN